MPALTHQTMDYEIPFWVRVSRSLAALDSTKPSRLKYFGEKLSSSQSSIPLATCVSIGMGIALALILLGQVFIGWATTTLDEWRYGDPRTYQTSAYVGQEGSMGQVSHFIALNNEGQVEIIELPGNDATRARIFLGPKLTGAQADLAPVTLQFVDLHHNHQPDMLVQVAGMTLHYFNKDGTFHLDER